MSQYLYFPYSVSGTQYEYNYFPVALPEEYIDVIGTCVAYRKHRYFTLPAIFMESPFGAGHVVTSTSHHSIGQIVHIIKGKKFVKIRM